MVPLLRAYRVYSFISIHPAASTFHAFHRSQLQAFAPSTIHTFTFHTFRLVF
jgi:hypothetical protein